MVIFHGYVSLQEGKYFFFSQPHSSLYSSIDGQIFPAVSCTERTRCDDVTLIAFEFHWKHAAHLLIRVKCQDGFVWKCWVNIPNETAI